MAICSCVLPLVNPKACEDCSNRSEPFDFIPSTNFIYIENYINGYT